MLAEVFQYLLQYLPTLIAGCLALLLFEYRNHAIGSKRAHPSLTRVPGSVPVFGAFFAVLWHYKTINDFFSNMFLKLEGQTVVVSMPFFPTYYVLTTPDILEYVLKTKFEKFVRGDFMDQRFRQVLGKGIFNADGEHWRVQRKTAANIFNTGAFKELVATVFQDKMRKLSLIIATAVEEKQTLDLQKYFFKITLDGFGYVGFGVEIDSLNKDIPFAISFDAAQAILDYRFMSPLWKLEEFFNGDAAKMRNHVAVIRNFVEKVIKDHEAQPQGAASQASDLITLFMNQTKSDGSKFSHDEIGDFIINFIIAGRDTTAQAMSWCVYELNRNPRVLQKLLEEIDSELGEADFPTYEQVKNMKYANAVFSETLRLWPSIPKLIRTARRDVTLPDGTLVPKGEAVIWSPFSFGKSKRIWGENAAEFYPERWLQPDKQPTQFEFPAFNCGPRICLGKSFAELEGVFILVSLLRKFEVKVLNIDHVTYSNSLTLPMKHGLLCAFDKRERTI